MLILMMFKGGISFGACSSVSEKGLRCFGSFTVTSILVQEIYGKCVSYFPFIEERGD
jgi:hypothetical protein